MTEQPLPPAPTVDVFSTIKRLRQGSLTGQSKTEVLERVREYEKAETTASPGAAPGIDRMSLLDPLTELYNVRTFLKEVKAELTRAKRYKQPCSICMLAVDTLESVTQQFGYLTADALMRVVANVLRTTLRETDIPAKYSAEVFTIILPQTGPAAAAIAAERIRKRIGNQAIVHNWQSFSVTASVGVASFPAHAEEYDQLIARAVEALEFALERGGDRVLSA
jgi:diguanylate cyclase (GGDEF)-like protein